MSLESNSAYKGLDRSFCIRMKSTLTKRGCHFKSSGYRVSCAPYSAKWLIRGPLLVMTELLINFFGVINGMQVVMILCRLRTLSQFSNSKLSEQQSLQQQQPLLGMIALAIALPPPTVYEVRLEPDMFVTRLSFDLRIIHCEPRYTSPTYIYTYLCAPSFLMTGADFAEAGKIATTRRIINFDYWSIRVSDLIDFAAEDLTGRSLYTLCHAEDVRLLRKSHTDCMQIVGSYIFYYCCNVVLFSCCCCCFFFQWCTKVRWWPRITASWTGTEASRGCSRAPLSFAIRRMATSKVLSASITCSGSQSFNVIRVSIFGFLVPLNHFHRF